MLVAILLLMSLRYIFVQENYPPLLQSIEQQRLAFANEYRKDKAQQKVVLNNVRQYLEETIVNQIFPAWYGTKWSFYGDAKYPLKGTVACGSFVENSLVNIGFKLHPLTSAQPAENIIKNLVKAHDIKRYSNTSIADFYNHMLKQGDGLYIVGLDHHVGFLVVKGSSVRFVHSGAIAVVSEKAKRSYVLSRSKYRVTGKILNDDMLTKWLLGEKFPLKYNYF